MKTHLECLEVLAAAFDQPMSEKRAKVYIHYLMNITEEKMCQATDKLILKCTRFPSIAEVFDELRPPYSGGRGGRDT